jgi:hypothetical protein
VGVEDREPPALLGEVVLDRQAGLTAADDDDDVVVLRVHAGWSLSGRFRPMLGR